MAFTGSVTLTYNTTGTLLDVIPVAGGDFQLRYSVLDMNGLPKILTVLVKADGSGIFNAQGVAVVAAGTYGGFLAQLQTVQSSFDAGLQAAAQAGKPVF